MRGLTSDSLVSLLNGTLIPIEDLNNAFSQDSFYLYSLNEYGITIGTGLLKYEGYGDVLEAILDDNSVIRCGLDQKFVMRDGSIKIAKDLREFDSLMPLYRRLFESGWLSGYETVYDPILDREIFTHQLVGSLKYPGKYPKTGYVIHHKDFNRLNNDWYNLDLMTFFDHRDFHSTCNNNIFSRLWADKDFRAAKCENSRETLTRLWANKEFADAKSKNSSETLTKTWQNEDFREMMTEKAKSQWTPELQQRAVEAYIRKWKEDPEWAANMRKLRAETSRVMMISRWQDEDYREKRVAIAKKWRNSPDTIKRLNEAFSKKSQLFKDKLGINFESIKKSIEAGCNSLSKICKYFGCSDKPIRSELGSNGISRYEQAPWIRSYYKEVKNHKVISVKVSSRSDLYSLKVNTTGIFSISGVFLLDNEEHHEKSIFSGY